MDYWKKRRVRESAPALDNSTASTVHTAFEFPDTIEHSATSHVHTAFESPDTIKVNKREERTCRIAKNEP